MQRAQAALEGISFSNVLHVFCVRQGRRGRPEAGYEERRWFVAWWKPDEKPKAKNDDLNEINERPAGVRGEAAALDQRMAGIFAEDLSKTCEIAGWTRLITYAQTHQHLVEGQVGQFMDFFT